MAKTRLQLLPAAPPLPAAPLMRPAAGPGAQRVLRLLLVLAWLSSPAGSLVSPRRFPPEELPLADAVAWLGRYHAGERICLALSDEGPDCGLGNFVGYINTVLDFAMGAGVRMLMPEMDPAAHSAAPGHSLANLFGTERKCDGDVMAYASRCDDRLPDASTLIYAWPKSHSRCGAGQFAVDLAAGQRTASWPSCDCEHVIVFPAIQVRYSFDYGRTAADLVGRYWAARASAGIVLPQRPLRCSRNVVAHVRLGDVSSHDCTTEPKLILDPPGDATIRGLRGTTTLETTKHICPEWYVSVLMAIMSALPSDCTCTSIVTDGNSMSADIRSIRSKLTEAGFPEPEVLGAEVPADIAFDVLTHSDLLVAGSSGFSRLAAVLSRSGTAVVGPTVESHPLGDESRVTLLSSSRGPELKLEAAEGLARNVAFGALQGACAA